MKSLVFRTVLFIVCSAEFLAFAQTSVDNSPALPPPTAFAVVSQDANSQVLERTVYEQTPNGKIVAINHRYTQLASGLNYWSNGQWTPSSEAINVLPQGGASAMQGQHQVYFPGDIYQGAIQLVTPDGQQLTSRPMGIFFDDGTNTVSIGTLTNSVGILASSNQVVYPDAFTGINADLVCTYRRGEFESDLVLREQLPDPAQLGLNPQTCRLQLLTEFFNTADPAITRTIQSPTTGLSDSTLRFGTMIMGHGRAFVVGAPSTVTPNVPVGKSWLHLQGRTFLLEEVPVPEIAPLLQSLPPPSSGTNGVSLNTPVLKASPSRLLAPYRPVQANDTAIRLAKVDVKSKPGMVLDYVALNVDTNNFTFQSDTTYLVGNPGGINFNGVTTFEGGTVIKFCTNPTNGSLIQSWDTNVCATGPYRPAVFTSVNDNSVGESISQPGTPLDYHEALAGDAAATTQWRYIVIRYADYGVQGHGNLSVSDSQFVDCGYPFFVYWGPGYFTNDLLVNMNSPFYGNAFNAKAYHLTIDNCTNNQLVVDFWGESASTVSFVNSLLVDVGSAGNATVTTNYTAWVTGGSSIFQTVGAGACYLATNSTYRNAGTTNIDPAILADIATKTTYPPIVNSNYWNISVNTTLGPQAGRDNIGSPDLGYHYEPLDYVFVASFVSNATVTITPGTAIGMTGNGITATWGIGIQAGAQFLAQGLANNPVTIACFDTVQEQPNFFNNWQEPPNGMLLDGWAPAVAINCRFTHFFALAGPNNIYMPLQGSEPVAFQDCEFFSGFFETFNPSINLTNCLFARVNLDLVPNDSQVPTIRNCLFWHGTFGYGAWTSTNNVIISDNLFDQTVIPDWMGAWGGDYTGGHNAYVTNFNTMDPLKTGDVILTNSPAYQTSWFGNFYLPPNSPLIDAGSTTADQVGLYHFTTQTNQAIEGTSIVDIGYHYVATDQYGNPLDTNGDGIPDYLEDANGNGIFDIGDLGDWQISPFGLGGNGSIQVFTPLK